MWKKKAFKMKKTGMNKVTTDNNGKILGAKKGNT